MFIIQYSSGCQYEGGSDEVIGLYGDLEKAKKDVREKIANMADKDKWEEYDDSNQKDSYRPFNEIYRFDRITRYISDYEYITISEVTETDILI